MDTTIAGLQRRWRRRVRADPALEPMFNIVCCPQHARTDEDGAVSCVPEDELWSLSEEGTLLAHFGLRLCDLPGGGSLTGCAPGELPPDAYRWNGRKGQP